MNTTSVGWALLLVCCQAQNPPPLACNLKALDREERQNHARLTHALFNSITERREIAGGYTYQLDSAKTSAADVGRWMFYEHRCCPFFRFRLDLDEAGTLWLSLSGGPGVKQFIESEFRQP